MVGIAFRAQNLNSRGSGCVATIVNWVLQDTHLTSQEQSVCMPPTAFDSVVRPRVMRVFVSSTFRDMHAERDELVKRVFPQLRKMCEERDVVWSEVDLRWGVTDEQVAEGQVLPVCLSEIEHCRPYFLGLLGERDGWVPDEYPPAIVQQEPWIKQHAGKSVTELEILHGVLNDSAMQTRAYFYFRDPAYLACDSRRSEASVPGGADSRGHCENGQ